MTRGKVMEYLGMKLDYSKKWKVRMCMFGYIDKMLEALPEDMRGISNMPALNHLFTINENFKVLKEDKAQLFHVVKLLCLCRSRTFKQL